MWIALAPRPWLWLALLSVALASSAVGFACNVEYARKESARGWLVSQQGLSPTEVGRSPV